MKKNRAYKYAGFIAVFTLLIFFSSCKTTKKYAVKRTLKTQGFEYLKQKMDSARLDFDYMSAKLSLTYDNGKSRTNLKAQMRIKEDSIIWISFSPAMGIEVARIALTCDSVKFINRMNKTYFAGKYKVLDSLINSSVNFLILQSMILGNDVPYYDVHNYKVKDGDDYYILEMVKKRKQRKSIKKEMTDESILVEKIWLNPETFRAKKIEMYEPDEKDKKLTVIYDDFRTIDGKPVPFKLKIKIRSEKTINIDVHYSRVQFVDKLTFPFKISSKYKKAF